MTKQALFSLYAILCFISFFQFGLLPIDRTEFIFQNDPIDVVIPCVEKDKETLDLCIQGIKTNGLHVRRVIVVSKNHLTDLAEWVPESSFPFSKEDIAFEIFRDQTKTARYLSKPKNRLGWIYQQLLKLYAPLVIEDISSNVLILDADTIYLRPVEFIQPNGAAYFNPGIEFHRPYFTHMARLLPDLHRIDPNLSGISHNMLFQRPVLLDLKDAIETYHQEPMWKALLHCIPMNHNRMSHSCLSEYEIYFNYALLRSDQFSVRKLRWKNVSSISCLDTYKDEGYHYVSAHAHKRKKALSSPLFQNNDTSACHQ